MDTQTKINRLNALYEGLRAERPKPDQTAAWFAASALVPAEGSVAELVAQTRTLHAAFKDVVGRHAAPSGSLRWVYAALMAHNGVPMERFAAARETLREQRKASKTGSLHAGGARAALVLCLASEADTPFERFYEMKKAILPPWWRAYPQTTDTFAAFHAARGDDPRVVVQNRARAEEVFTSSRKARGHKREGARLCVLMDAEPRTVLRRYEGLLDARGSFRKIRSSLDRSFLMEWAAQGLETSDIEAIAEIREHLPKSVSTLGSARLRLAHLLHIQGRDVPEGGQLAAMAAVIAAQTAVIVAATSATTVAVTAS